MTTSLPQVYLKLSEKDGIYGPVLQGEGADLGRACFFLRLHGCPVRCPGCDTHFTWDGSEQGAKVDLDDIEFALLQHHHQFPKAGLVVSGGEPIIHFRNTKVVDMLYRLKHVFPWTSVETSGFVSPKELTEPQDHDDLSRFLHAFTRVHCSPKVTACLHGQEWTDEQLLCNLGNIIAYCPRKLLVLKFVVRDAADVAKVEEVDKKFGLTDLGDFVIYLMPYGVERDEIIQSIKDLMPHVARTGYILTPRLHSILFGKARGV